MVKKDDTWWWTDENELSHGTCHMSQVVGARPLFDHAHVGVHPHFTSVGLDTLLNVFLTALIESAPHHPRTLSSYGHNPSYPTGIHGPT